MPPAERSARVLTGMLALTLAFPSIVKMEQLAELTGGANGKLAFIPWVPPAWLPLEVTNAGWAFLTLCMLAALLFWLASNAIRSRAGYSPGGSADGTRFEEAVSACEISNPDPDAVGAVTDGGHTLLMSSKNLSIDTIACVLVELV